MYLSPEGYTIIHAFKTYQTLLACPFRSPPIIFVLLMIYLESSLSNPFKILI